MARRIEGATAKDVRAHMTDLAPGQVPAVTQAGAIQQSRQLARAERRTEPEIAPTLTPAARGNPPIERDGKWRLRSITVGRYG